MTERQLPADEKVCAAAGCENSSLDGRFVGDFCAPCDADMRTGKFISGNAVPYKLAECMEVLKKALRDSGCDGDLCGYEWHERARHALAELEECFSG